MSVSFISSPPSTPAPAAARGGRPYLITADAYSRMIACGAIPSGSRVELWEGQLVEKMSKNRPHNAAMKKIAAALFSTVPAGWHVGPECSLRLSDLHVPEPDLAVVRGDPDDYLDRDPTPADVALVVEVADSSVPKDLGRMRAAYAAGGVPAYWVVNLPAGRIEAHAEPVGGEAPGYRQVHSYGPGEAVPLVLDGQPVAELPVAALLPRPTGA